MSWWCAYRECNHMAAIFPGSSLIMLRLEPISLQAPSWLSVPCWVPRKCFTVKDVFGTQTLPLQQGGPWMDGTFFLQTVRVFIIFLMALSTAMMTDCHTSGRWDHQPPAVFLFEAVWLICGVSVLAEASWQVSPDRRGLTFLTTQPVMYVAQHLMTAENSVGVFWGINVHKSAVWLKWVTVVHSCSNERF